MTLSVFETIALIGFAAFFITLALSLLLLILKFSIELIKIKKD